MQRMVRRRLITPLGETRNLSLQHLLCREILPVLRLTSQHNPQTNQCKKKQKKLPIFNRLSLNPAAKRLILRLDFHCQRHGEIHNDSSWKVQLCHPLPRQSAHCHRKKTKKSPTENDFRLFIYLFYFLIK